MLIFSKFHLGALYCNKIFPLHQKIFSSPTNFFLQQNNIPCNTKFSNSTKKSSNLTKNLLIQQKFSLLTQNFPPSSKFQSTPKVHSNPKITRNTSTLQNNSNCLHLLTNSTHWSVAPTTKQIECIREGQNARSDLMHSSEVRAIK